ncbi:GNAT family N-acetyltransferase [Flavobacterium soli]|uniref:GNAT family N-acetyltransferase n=1 Tax=Flavobacterium soli TaxID=344881 RepID=UPI000686E7AE|nr:GNAT family N-acetyltransferase [Flavobacterium soli]
MDIRLTTTNQNFKIEKYTENDREQILNVWGKSVLATHDFLNPTDFKEIKQLVQTFNFNDFEVYCLKQNDEVAGFIGLAERKIEMLFFSPEYIGKGLGRKLVDFAFSELKADKVDVNEQNTSAVKFYEKLGFKTYERTDKDDQGKEYPLLRMKLETTKN